MLRKLPSLPIFAAYFLLANVSLGATPGDDARQADRLLTEEIFTPAKAEPVGLVDDETFFRRITLDLLGRQPTADEATRFVLDPSSDKRAAAIRAHLADKQFGVNWARYWRDVILYRRTEQRALLAAGSLQEFLTERLNANASWGETAMMFVTAEGKVAEKGETALIMAQEGKPEETVAEISRIFLGIQIQCAQCHDHPTDRWKREEFHQLAAFFPRVASRPEMGDVRSWSVVVNDSPFTFRRGQANNRFRGTPEHFMPDLNNPESEGKKMQPVFFLSGQSVPLGTRDSDRRASLAVWLTSKEQPYFSQALVNRLWSELVGEGFHEPIDDLGPDREIAARKTFDHLAATFTASNYDMKRLFETIMLTEAYQRESRPRRNPNETPFLANRAQRLRADQLYDNLLNVFDLKDTTPSGGYGEGPLAAARSPRFAVSAVFGYDPSDPREDIQGSIPQALTMMNGRVINSAVRAVPGGWLAKMLAKTSDNEAAITEVYLKILAREPSVKETNVAVNYIKESNNRTEAFEDLQWSLVNSTEFLHR